MGEKLKLSSKLGYTASEFGSSLLLSTSSGFLMIFYTDVFGLNPAAVGTLFLLTRLWDAISDPIMGIIIDKTNSRFGKCRPYFLWMALPLALANVLMFTTFDVSSGMRLAYAAVTYVIMGMLYTAINIPVSAILPRLTLNEKHRVQYGTFRVLGSAIGMLSVGAVTWPLIRGLGGDFLERGFQGMAIIYSLVAVIMFIVAFITLKEKEDIKVESLPVKENLTALVKNRAWLIIFALGIFTHTAINIRSASTIYFMMFNVGREDLMPVMGSMALIMLVSLVLCYPLSAKIGKVNTIMFGVGLMSLGLLVVSLFGDQSLIALFTGTAITIFGVGFAQVLYYVLVSDAVDYGEWKYNVNASGLVSATTSFGHKLGASFGGAMVGWILAIGGYVAGAEQTDSALFAIRTTFAIIPFIATVCMLGLLFVYKKIDALQPRIAQELMERRAAALKNTEEGSAS
jgi:GPH family glycoside/pentoside/hexuronide:cation symporter